MVLIINKDLTDLAFYYWINGFPLSGHQLDRSRFLGFIITARRYRCKRYNTFKKFRAECLAYKNDLSGPDIKDFWLEKQRIEDFLDDIKNAEIPPHYELVSSKDHSITQQNIIDHKLCKTKITMEESNNGGISRAEVKRRAKNTINASGKQ